MNRKKILLFGGTSEGVELARALSERGNDVTVSVATEYGALMLDGVQVRVLTGRLNQDAMTALMQGYEQVIDATHPYATEVTENIKAAALESKTPYQRIVRPEGALEDGWLMADSPQEAVEQLKRRNGNILLTTGSKDLAAFAALPDYKQRVWVRILASEASLHQALMLGYPANHIIAMHGPFSQKLNIALMEQFHIKTVVTKRTGRAGGFWEKADAAKAVGAALVVIDRPLQEEGLTVAELLGVSPPNPFSGVSPPNPFSGVSPPNP